MYTQPTIGTELSLLVSFMFSIRTFYKWRNISFLLTFFCYFQETLNFVKWKAYITYITSNVRKVMTLCFLVKIQWFISTLSWVQFLATLSNSSGNNKYWDLYWICSVSSSPVIQLQFIPLQPIYHLCISLSSP